MLIEFAIEQESFMPIKNIDETFKEYFKHANI